MALKKIYFAAALVVCSTVATWLLHSAAGAKFHERELLFRAQERQLTQLTQEQQRRSAAVEHGVHPATEDRAAEIARLRAEAEALRKQTNGLAKQIRKNAQAPGAPTSGASENQSPEYLNALRVSAGNRDRDTQKLATAFLLYAVGHNGRVASDFDGVAAELDKVTKELGQSPVSGAGQFDIVFHGSLTDLNGVPGGNIAVLRHRETWTAPDGRRARVYGMLDGHTQIVTSDDNFQSWEAEHIIDPAATQ